MDGPLISEADIDGQERRCQDDSHASDNGQSGEDGNADPGRHDVLNGPILGRLIVHPGYCLLVQDQRVGRIVVFGHLFLVRSFELLHRQPTHPLVVFEMHSTLIISNVHSMIITCEFYSF